MAYDVSGGVAGGADVFNTNTANQGFYGLSVEALEKYIDSIKTAVISSNENSATSKLKNCKEEMYKKIRESWTGTAEEKFEKNFNEAIRETIDVLEDMEKRLEGYLNAIANAWIEQDKKMIGD